MSIILMCLILKKLNQHISLTANDGVFTSDEENVTVSINNVWDMKISSTTIEDAYCGGGSTGSISLDVIGNEGSVSVIWRKGNEEIFNGDESGLSITDLSTGLYSVTITDMLDLLLKIIGLFLLYL